MHIRHLVMGVLVLSIGFSSVIFAQQTKSDSEMTVEDAYLQSFETMIVNELVNSDGRDNKNVALQYIKEAIDRGNVSPEMSAALSSLATESTVTVARESGRIVNNYPDVRAKACEYLGKVGTKEAKDTLLKVLYSEQEPMVMTEAIRSLGNMGINEADETTDMIAKAGRKYNILNPTSSLALEILNAFEKLAPTVQDTSNMLQMIITIASNYQYVTPVRTRAYEVLKTISNSKRKN